MVVKLMKDSESQRILQKFPDIFLLRRPSPPSGWDSICVTYHMPIASYNAGVSTLNFRLYREFFRALSNQTRFAIVQSLRRKPHYVNEMVESLGIEQSRISHNLACLLNCGFVEWEWNGKNRVYRLHRDLLPILNVIEKHLARYAPALESCQVLEREAKQAVFLVHPSGPRQSKRRERKRSKVNP